MRNKFRLYQRKIGGRYYIHDAETGKQESLGTTDRNQALRLLHAKNESHLQPVMNLQIARAYLMASDPMVGKRTWQHVMDEIISTKKGITQVRWKQASKDHAIDLIRNMPLLQTRAEHLLKVLKTGTVTTNVYCSS